MAMGALKVGDRGRKAIREMGGSAGTVRLQSFER